MTYKLKPCPFPVCLAVTEAGIFAASSLSGDGTIGWSGKCKKCGSRGPIRGTPDEAAAAWNERDPKMHRCSPETCGHLQTSKHIVCPDPWHRTPSREVYHTCSTCGAH
jgi:hypothetical protein